MVGRIESRPLEDDAHGRDQPAQRIFATLWAFGQRRIVEALIAIETEPALIASVSIRRHSLSLRPTIIKRGSDMTRPVGLVPATLLGHCLSRVSRPPASCVDAAARGGYDGKAGGSARRSRSAPLPSTTVKVRGGARKVRAPQGRVPGNTPAGRPADRATEMNRSARERGLHASTSGGALRAKRGARVKRWCKRPPAVPAMGRPGNPHPEQGQAGARSCPLRSSPG